jgi:hypothetical protein
MSHVAESYARFAELEAAGVSAIYETWGLGVADDEEVQALIAALPRGKQQPNLVFAAVRSLGKPLVGYGEFRDRLVSDWVEVVPVILSRSTQTNEAGRCATLLPQLAAIDGPVALLEVGASAGLCLYPDRYSYRYQSAVGITTVDPPGGPSPMVLDCELLGPANVPVRVPDVVWRAGVDLNPLDVADPATLAWLELLIWPEHDERRKRLHAAAGIVAADPPQLVAGDLNIEVAELVSQAPEDATLVLFHSAVLVYLTPEERSRFVDQVSSLDVVWLSNEGTRVLPEVTMRVPAGVEPGGDFVLARNGEPVALTGPHGQHYRTLQTP